MDWSKILSTLTTLSILQTDSSVRNIYFVSLNFVQASSIQFFLTMKAGSSPDLRYAASLIESLMDLKATLRLHLASDKVHSYIT